MAFDRMGAMEARYREMFPQLTDAQRKVRLLTAEEYWIPTLRMAEAHAGTGSETYFYRFDYPRSRGPLAGEAPHGSELGFVWDDEHATQTAERIDLMRAIHGAWVDFIQGQAPTIANAPAWPRFDSEERRMMLIDRVSTVALDPDAAERHLWDGWPAASASH
jgi:para-nitrobenzyl esterase